MPFPMSPLSSEISASPEDQVEASLSSEERSARDYAKLVHGEQRWGPYPYLVHLDRVYRLLRSMGAGRSLRMAAYLHDTVEDSPKGPVAQFWELVELFGDDIAVLVLSVSAKTGNRKVRQMSIVDSLQRAQQTHEQVFGEGSYAPAIDLKMADRLVNMWLSLELRDAKFLALQRSEDALGYGELFAKGHPELYRMYRQLF